MNINARKFPTLAKLADRQEKRIKKFQTESSKVFHPHAVTLCRRIKKGIPKFEGCQLAMRELYLEPMNLNCVKVIAHDTEGQGHIERLQNVWNYIRYPREDWTLDLPQDTIDALTELDELANYIDDNYSNVATLYVKL